MSARHPRTSLALIGAAAALVLPLLAVASSQTGASAAAPKQHQLTTYKVEKQVELDGEFPTNTKTVDLSCRAGDYVLDGMWRVDQVDQANPDLDISGDERDVRAIWSYGDAGDAALWHFKFTNFAEGAGAQLKVFLTCIDSRTEGQNGHRHPLNLSNQYLDTQSMLTVKATVTHPQNCGSNAIPVAPGFKLLNGPSRIYRSWPTPNNRGWQWAFVNTDGTNVELSLRCLIVKTHAAAGHAHNIKYTFTPGHDGQLRHLGHGNQVNRQEECSSQEKAMVAGFWVVNPDYVWYLGMDPRPKLRNFRYFYKGGGSNDVYHTLTCINTRTGFQIAP